MKNIRKFALSGLVLVAFWAVPGVARDNQKLAQTGFQFLTVVSDARAAAMGNAVNSLAMGSSSIFFNPAGLAEMDRLVDISVSDNQWIAGIRHTAASLALRPGKGRWGTLAFSLQNVDYGDNLFGTVVVPESVSEDGYIDTGDLNPSAFAVGVGYGKMLNDRFSVGGQVRMVRQDFGDFMIPETDTTQAKTSKFAKTPLAFDFGTLFRTGFKSLTFGMSVRNFAAEVKYIRESFELPLVFTLGISADLMDWLPEAGFEQSAILSFDAKHDRSHAEQVCVGLDYRVMRLVSARVGVISANDENAVTAGIGLSWSGLAVDYAYAPYGVWDSVQRLTLRLSH
jgi:hypothetical protein